MRAFSEPSVSSGVIAKSTSLPRFSCCEDVKTLTRSMSWHSPESDFLIRLSTSSMIVCFSDAFHQMHKNNLDTLEDLVILQWSPWSSVVAARGPRTLASTSIADQTRLPSHSDHSCLALPRLVVILN
jgi:hypothetical protein